jgi:hypothetical protein
MPLHAFVKEFSDYFLTKTAFFALAPGFRAKFIPDGIFFTLSAFRAGGPVMPVNAFPAP